MTIKFFYSILYMSLIFTGTFISLKSSFLVNSLTDFVNFVALQSAGFKCLTILHLNHSLSSIFSILINPFLGWFNSFGNLI